MTTITVTEAGASGRYIDLGSPSNQDDIGAQTIIVYCKPASQSGNIGYYFSKSTSSGNGPRLIQDTANKLNFGVDSSGSSLNPGLASVSALTLSTWQHLEVTWDGGLSASGIALYVDGTDVGTGGASSNGSGSITSDASNNVFLLNRTGFGRHALGDTAYVARWNRVLNSTERTNVRANGPLSEPSGLILCFANGQDYSTNAVSVSGRTTQVAGSTPSNTALGGSSDTTISATPGNAAAAGVTAAIGSGTTISATPGNAAAAGVTATISATTNISATPGNAAAAGVTATVTTITLDASYERSSVDLSGSSVSGTTISIKPKLQEAETTNNRWLEPSVDVLGVNGVTPIFRFLSYFDGNNGLEAGAEWGAARRASYSLDDGLTWLYFDNTTVDVGNQWVQFSNNTPFAQNKIRVGRSRQITVHQVGDWVAAQGAAHSFLVPTSTAASYTPSGSVAGFAAQTFIADEYSTQTDSLGATIPVTPLYAFEVNDTSIMPLDGSPKYVMVLTAGVHAGENMGIIYVQRMVEHLCGSSAEALVLRRRFRTLVYPCINAPGLAGGGWRGSFTQGVGGFDDANRHFDNLSCGLEIVTKPRAAMATDLAGQWPKISDDSHGTFRDTYSFSRYAGNSWHTRLQNYWTSFSGVTIADDGDYIAGTVSAYWQDNGTLLAFTGEFGDEFQITDSDINGVAIALVKSFAAMTTDGDFDVIATVPGNATANGVTATITAGGVATIVATPGNASAAGATAIIASTKTISATPANAAADGSMAAVIRKITASPGDAVANGAIAALLRIISATPGNAAAIGITAIISGAGPATATVARPSGDVSNASWTPSTGVVLYAMLDEVTPDAADYIITSTTGAICKMDLSATAYPGTAVQQLKYRASSSTGNSVIIRLKDGATTIRSQTQVLSATESEYTITLTSGEIAAITSGSLQVEIESA